MGSGAACSPVIQCEHSATLMQCEQIPYFFSASELIMPNPPRTNTCPSIIQGLIERKRTNTIHPKIMGTYAIGRVKVNSRN